MYRKFALLYFMVMSCIYSYGQINRTKSWYFGEGLSIKFGQTGIDTVKTNLKGFTYEGTSVWNSNSGNLIYYSDWGNIYDSNGILINITFKLGGDGSASQGTILTSLNDTLLHCFGASAEIYNVNSKLGGFNYSVYDLINRKWLISGLKLRKSASECQTLINHQNGKWQWVVSHSRLGDTLYSYLITENGLETCPVISHAGPFYNDWYPGQGVMKFSADGKYLFVGAWSLGKVTVCDFNNQTGLISEKFRIDITDSFPYGIEIQGNNLFVSFNRPNDIIFQYSLKKMEYLSVMNSRKLLFDTSAMDAIGQLQLAPDGKIYVAVVNQSRLAYLDPAKNYKYSYTKNLFGTKKCYGGFPSFNASYFHTPALNFTYTRNCNNNTFIFKAIDTINASSWQWQYSKGNNSFASNGKQTSFTFTDTGIWQVRCIATNGNRNDTVIKNITILNPMKSEYLGEDILLPLGANVSGSIAGPNGMHCNHWQKLGGTAEKLGNTYMYHDTGTFVCKATNTVFCNYIDTIKVQVCDSFARAATIDRSGDSLFTKTFAVKYQWYLNDTAINGATKSVLKLNQKGVYKLRTWNAANCDSFSTTFDVNKLGTQKFKTQVMRIFPNPNNGSFEIQSTDMPIQSVVLYDVTGNKVFEKQGFQSKNIEIDLNLTSGIYLITINGKNHSKLSIY